MGQECDKYMLEENDIHYFSGKDGSLYVQSEEKLYGNHLFCVDYLNDMNIENPSDELVVSILRIFAILRLFLKL